MCNECAETRLQQVFAQFRGRRAELIPLFQATQAALGYLPTWALRAIADFTSVPESQVYGVATFYSQFHLTPRGNHVVKACHGTACHVKGATRILEALERELGVACGGTTKDFEYSLERVACVGSCALAPVVVVDGAVHGQVEGEKIKGILHGRQVPQAAGHARQTSSTPGEE
jgi:NADH:ubiquinone oxidoreductase subunit E